GRAILERVEQEAEAAMRLLGGESERREDLRLHVPAVNTDRPRSKLDTIQDNVVGFRTAARRVRGQLLKIVVMHGSEWMMGCVPTVLLRVPLEHREIHDPEEFEFLRI